jgi:serine/threonine protein kinase
MWSAGVILHILLVGFPPFYGENEPTLFENIKAANYSFDDPAWKVVSKEAKDLVSKLLVVDPSRRLSARDALSHPWCSNSCPKSSLENVAPNVKKNLLAERLKSAARSVVARIRRLSVSAVSQTASLVSSRRDILEMKSSPELGEDGELSQITNTMSASIDGVQNSSAPRAKNGQMVESLRIHHPILAGKAQVSSKSRRSSEKEAMFAPSPRKTALRPSIPKVPNNKLMKIQSMRLASEFDKDPSRAFHVEFDESPRRTSLA